MVGHTHTHIYIYIHIYIYRSTDKYIDQRMYAQIHNYVGFYLFVVVLHRSNNISVISWQWCDVWDEKEKAQTYTFTDSKDLLTPRLYKHGMKGTGLWWHCKLYTVGKRIAAQQNVIAVTGTYPCPKGHIPRVLTNWANSLFFLFVNLYLENMEPTCHFPWLVTHTHTYIYIFTYTYIDRQTNILISVCMHRYTIM